jgi:glycosyltransferase involved in cell wall biosynthesis
VPKVSIIVPNYNHARFLRQRIDSILQQTFQDFELILLDDSSTDDSRSILSSYMGDPRVRIEFNEVNSGSAFKQWNKGVRLARAEYVWIAESDDYADERLLERLLTVLDAKPTVAYAYCRSWLVSEDGRLDGFAGSHLLALDRFRWTEDHCVDGREECRSYFVRANVVPNASGVVFRKVLYDRTGGADENLHLCGDWKLWAAMALTGNVAYLAAPLNYFRSHNSSLRTKTSQLNMDVMEYLSVMRWVLGQVTPTKAVHEKLGQAVANMWVPAVMSTHVPLGVKRAILRSVRGIDPHPIRNAFRPALGAMHRKLARHWRALCSMLD